MIEKIKYKEFDNDIIEPIGKQYANNNYWALIKKIDEIIGRVNELETRLKK